MNGKKKMSDQIPSLSFSISLGIVNLLISKFSMLPPLAVISNCDGTVTVVEFASYPSVLLQFTTVGFAASVKFVCSNNLIIPGGRVAVAPMLKPATDNINSDAKSSAKKAFGILSVTTISGSGSMPFKRMMNPTVSTNSNIHMRMHQAIENWTAVTIYHTAPEPAPDST